MLERRGVRPHARDVQPALVGEGVLAHVRLVGVGREVEQLVDEVRDLGELAPGAPGATTSRPIFSWRLAMIETRFALPVRSPTPFIVPWTWRAPASTAVSVFATPHSASLWPWKPTRTRSPSAATHRGASPRPPGAGSDEPFVSHRQTVSAPPRAAASRHCERVGAVVAEAVEEVLGVVDDALAGGGEERDRLLDHREVLGAVDADDLLEVQRPGLADDRAHRGEAAREDPQALVLLGA